MDMSPAIDKPDPDFSKSKNNYFFLFVQTSYCYVQSVLFPYYTKKERIR